jgi:hypothetical protein
MSKRNEAIWDAFAGPINAETPQPPVTLAEDEEEDRG